MPPHQDLSVTTTATEATISRQQQSGHDHHILVLKTHRRMTKNNNSTDTSEYEKASTGTSLSQSNYTLGHSHTSTNNNNTTNNHNQNSNRSPQHQQIQPNFLNIHHFDIEQRHTPNSPMSKESNHNIYNEPILVLGINIANLSRIGQFIVCAGGVFSFSLLYGYLQELISVSMVNRQLGLFLATMQFLGYSIWSKFFHTYIQSKTRHNNKHHYDNNININHNNINIIQHQQQKSVSFRLYLLLSILRAIDAGMTNMAMAYVNYPAKTLMKSSRVVFTMLFGSIIRRKKYKPMDYLVVTFMVSGLAIFMHADSQSSAVFQPIGIIMLTTSLLCDGAINNMSEAIMIQYNIGQDEFIYNLYSIATCGLIAAATIRGDLTDGFRYITTAGTWEEIQNNSPVRSWGVLSKLIILILFSSAGFFGSSCSALITKEFGALTMSITSTARKATTLFLSFALFNNVCTVEHLSGIFLFITALVVKSLRVSKHSGKKVSNNRHGYHDDGGKGHHHEISDTHSGYSNSYSDDDYNVSSVEVGETTPKMESKVSRRLRRRREHVVANIV